MDELEIVEANNHKVIATSFREDLIVWGKAHFRPFLWRLTNDPYRILMAEIMLHRTQARQVAPVYSRFIETYPDLTALTRANQAEISTILYSLGLRWRIDLILDMVAALSTQFEGKIPQEKTDLLSLPGVSTYVASAVRCFAWNMPDAIIDTNTVRVIGRVFGLTMKDSSRRNPLFRKLLTAMVSPTDACSYNYALLDLAALICVKVREPQCEVCPVQQYCLYGTRKLNIIKQ